MERRTKVSKTKKQPRPRNCSRKGPASRKKTGIRKREDRKMEARTGNSGKKRVLSRAGKAEEQDLRRPFHRLSLRGTQTKGSPVTTGAKAEYNEQQKERDKTRWSTAGKRTRVLKRGWGQRVVVEQATGRRKTRERKKNKTRPSWTKKRGRHNSGCGTTRGKKDLHSSPRRR